MLILLVSGAAALRASCVMSVAGGRPSKPYTFLTIQPKFTIHDWSTAQPILERMVDCTRAERGCAYYGFTRCTSENSLFCNREW